MQYLFGNNRSTKSDIIRKIIPRARARANCHFCKILNEKSSSYLFNLIPNLNIVHGT